MAVQTTVETSRIAEQLRLAVAGPAWHGPAFLESLASVSAVAASNRPLSHAHSIWEIALHTATWLQVVQERLDGRHRDVSDDEDWPAVVDDSDEAWARLKERIATAAEALAARIESFPDEALDERLPGASAGSSAYVSMHGCVQHVTYHAGQISVLKKG